MKSHKLQDEASQPQATYSCGYSDRLSDPEAYFREGLTILIQASVLLQDEKLFANGVSKSPASLPQDAFQDIGKDINSQTIEFFKFG